jgi:hypothetical protein
MQAVKTLGESPWLKNIENSFPVRRPTHEKDYLDDFLLLKHGQEEKTPCSG